MKRHGDNGRNRLAGAAMRCQSDSRLVRLAREGHDRAFEEIVRRYRSPLVSYAGGIVPDHHAEDVVQEALRKAHGALETSDAEINLRPWLYTIVRNRALNALRDEPTYDHLDENFDGVPQPPEVAARREELAALTAKVRGLPDPQRQAIVKRELEGRSHEEIASSLGVSPGAVRGLIYRARATLRDGAGMLIPMPVLRVLLSSGSAPEGAGAAGAAAGLAAGSGGIAVKAGATLGVAVIAVGSGIAIQHRSSGAGDGQSAPKGGIHSARVQAAGESSAAPLAGALAGREAESGHGGPGPGDSSGPGGGGGSAGSSSGPGSGSGSGSSGEGSASGDGDRGGGSGPSGDDGGGGGTSGTSDDGGSSGGSDDGSSGTGSSGSGISGSGSSGSDGGGSSGSGSSGSGDDGGSSGSGLSGGGGTTTTTTSTTTTSTTTTSGGDGGGGSGSD
jgi:RNA polymerase sigma factor (sigma-70 family)